MSGSPVTSSVKELWQPRTPSTWDVLPYLISMAALMVGMRIEDGTDLIPFEIRSQR
jgi:hypothetical protein